MKRGANPQISQLQEQLNSLTNGVQEIRARQQSQEERLKKVLDYLEKQQQQQSPSSSQSSITHSLQRKQSIQRTPSRRPSNVTRLVLDDSDRRQSHSASQSQDLDSFIEADLSAGHLGTPPQSSPPPPTGSQPSSGGSGIQSPATNTKGLRSAPTFSTPSSLNSKSTSSYTPASSLTSLGSIQRQPSGSMTSPTLRRNKSMVMANLPSPNTTPTHASYNYPAQYTPQLATIESGQVISQDITTRPHTSHHTLQQNLPQSAQPPATYQSAAAPYATPPRLSHLSQPQFTTPQFQTPLRQDQYIPESLQLGSPASFTPTTSLHQFQQMQQQQQQQQRRRRQDSEVTEDMDLS